MNLVQPGSFLTLHYRLAGPDGADIVNTFADKPATLSLGTGELAAALEQRLLGLAEGTRTVFDVPAGEAFGQRNPELLQRVKRSLLDELGDAVVPARRVDMAAVREMLAAAELPVDDVADDRFGSFFCLRNEHGLVGCVGIEVLGDDAIPGTGASAAVEPASVPVASAWAFSDEPLQWRAPEPLPEASEVADDPAPASGRHAKPDSGPLAAESLSTDPDEGALTPRPAREDTGALAARLLGRFPKTLIFAANDLPHTSHANQPDLVMVSAEVDRAGFNPFDSVGSLAGQLAGQLGQRCSKNDIAATSYCFAYIAAVTDSARAYEIWLHAREFCLPARVAQSEVRRAFMTYLSAYPANAQGQAASVVINALKTTYPCD